jgi:hypothetical protein
LFDRIKGCRAGYRILVGFFESLRRSALTTHLPIDITREGFIEACCQRLATSPAIPPVAVSSGPIPAGSRDRGGLSEEFDGEVEEGIV